jgi:secondary thiamine-phosphate synthase enzyme
MPMGYHLFIMWLQKSILLKPRPRGFHLVTGEILAQLPELARFKVGLAHFFILHTSASLTLNENADPDVRRDLETQLRHLAPDGAAHYVHTLEGPDDMAAHIKSSLMGAGVTVPIGEGRLRLGTWQGLYLGEHREHGGARSLVATLNGESY